MSRYNLHHISSTRKINHEDVLTGAIAAREWCCEQWCTSSVTKTGWHSQSAGSQSVKCYVSSLIVESADWDELARTANNSTDTISLLCHRVEKTVFSLHTNSINFFIIEDDAKNVYALSKFRICLIDSWYACAKMVKFKNVLSKYT